MIVNGPVLLSSPGGEVGVGVGQTAPKARELKRLARMMDKTEVLIFDTKLSKRVKTVEFSECCLPQRMRGRTVG